MELSEYRASELEVIRSNDLLRMVEGAVVDGGVLLDVGARDGYFSKLLSKYYFVHALDLEVPTVDCERVFCVKGDASSLDYPDDYFDFVFCAEVLEHIPEHVLSKACLELSRVSSKYLLVGVPYKQDIRFGRTTCSCCGEYNPPWGHVNVFDEDLLAGFFSDFTAVEVSFVGKTKSVTNSVSSKLMDVAGNPYGTYDQEELCISCGSKLVRPPVGSVGGRCVAKLACWILYLQMFFTGNKSNWVHILFIKK